MSDDDIPSKPRLWRQGDVLIQQAAEIPDSHKGFRRKKPVLFKGEASGHKHAFKDGRAIKLYRNPRSHEIYIEVVEAEAVLTHQEHGPILLSKGYYRAWRQREYDEFEEERWVLD